MKIKTMKKTLVLLAALAGGSFVGAADSAAPASTLAPSSSYSVTVDFPYVSKYVFRGQEINKGAFQPSVEVTSSDFYGGLWTNFPILNPKGTKDETTELDAYVGYNYKLSDLVKLDGGLTFYYYPRAHKSKGSNEYTEEAYFGVDLALCGFTPSLYGYYDFKLRTWTTQAAVGYSIPLKDLGTSLDLSATVGRVAPGVGKSYLYYAAGLTVPVKLSDRAKLNLGLTYSGLDLNDTRKPGLWYTAGIVVGF